MPLAKVPLRLVLIVLANRLLKNDASAGAAVAP
jgi:hypothetical protein